MLKETVKAIVLLVAIVIIAGAIITPVTTLFQTLSDASNESLTTEYSNYTTPIYSGYQIVLGTFLVLSGISIVVLYIAQSHRKEREEFEYYENYR